MLDKFKRNLDIKKQAISPIRKPARLDGRKMKSLSRKKHK
jgi:hypothetical protein